MKNRKRELRLVVDLHAQRLRPNQLSDNKISPWDTQQTATRLHWTHFFLLFCILSVFYHCPLYNPALKYLGSLCLNMTQRCVREIFTLVWFCRFYVPQDLPALLFLFLARNLLTFISSRCNSNAQHEIAQHGI